MREAAQVTGPQLLEAAGWKRKNVAACFRADLWIDPQDPAGRPWFGNAAILEELSRREKAAKEAPPPRPAAPSTVEPPPSQATRDPADDSLLF